MDRMKSRSTRILPAAFIALSLAAIAVAPPAHTQKKKPTRDGGGHDTVSAVEPNRGGEMNLEAQDPEVALSRLTAAEGYEVNLFASEAEFPIGNPVSMAVDGKGRVWVSTMPTYPQYYPGRPPEDKLVILEDTDGDGKADEHTVFADGLHLAAGFELGDGGVYVAQQPNLVFLKDTDGDNVADTREVVLHGFGTEDSHHAISVFTWGPGGGLYFQEGTFHHSQVETPWGPVRVENAAVFRYEPTTEKLSVFVSYPFANPWGHCWDDWGQNFIADASGGANYFAAAFSGRVDYPRKHPRMKEFTPSKVRPTAGCEIVGNPHFPEKAQGNFLLNNTIGFHGIKQHRIIEEGSGFTAQEVEPLLQSADINFRPVDLQFGADGALYVVDWFNPVIGHMQYSLRDPRRDTGHGRIWRITHKDRPLTGIRSTADQTIEQLLDALKSEDGRYRYRVRRELRERDPHKVEAALRKWVAGIDSAEKDYEHHLLEGLWLFQSLDVVEPELLNKLLRTRDYRARAAATRVVRYWHDRLDQPLRLLERQVHDEHPRVRLEAVVALSFLSGPEAAAVALEALRHETDYYLEYGLKETLATLKPDWKPLISSGKPFAEDNPDGLAFLLDQIETGELAEFAPSRLVLRELIDRGEGESTRTALAGMAKLNGTTPTAELLAAIRRADEAASGRESLIKILGAWDPDKLNGVRPEIEELAMEAGSGVIRRGAFAALIRADGNGEKAWELAAESGESLADLLETIPLLPDAELRSALYPKVRPLLEELPEALSSSSGPELSARVKRAAITALGGMDHHAGEAFALLGDFVKDERFRHDAIGVLADLPEQHWDADQARPLIDNLLEYASGASEEERDTADFRAAMSFGLHLAGLLPDEETKKARSSFEDYIVQTIRIAAVPKELRFDKLSFSVEAGRPVEIIFDNPDEMPHNLLITKPGALREVGEAGDAMAGQPDAFEKNFVPDTPKVLWATPLLNKGESFRLRFTAPEEPDGYPYVCTFPGHWITMNGMMYVRPANR